MIVYGVNPVREALKAGRGIRALHVARKMNPELERLVADAKRAGARVELSERAALDALAGTDRHQGIVAELTEAAEAADVDAILSRARGLGEDPLVLVLDGIQDPHNLGALIRTAYGLGAHGVVIPAHRAAAVTPTVMKTSAGAAAHLPIATVTNIKHALDALKDAGVWLAAAVLEGTLVEEARLEGPLALVIGGEGEGVRPTVAARCDLAVRIGLARGFDSLNASVAGGILLHEAVRQRRAAKRAP